MVSSNLLRWSGLAALIGGGLFVVDDIADSLLFGSQAYSEAAATGAWILIQGAYVVAAVLIGLGLVGLYVRQSEQAGTLGVIAFLVAFTGAMMAIGSTWSEAFFGAWLAQAAPELVDADPPGALIGRGHSQLFAVCAGLVPVWPGLAASADAAARRCDPADDRGSAISCHRHDGTSVCRCPVWCCRGLDGLCGLVRYRG